MDPMSRWNFSKGHGTLNDFVILADHDGTMNLTEGVVRALCDRRAGIGGDGVLRAVRARHIPEWDGDPDIWFMDYRNADGSTAEMCGNGLRVFVRFLVDADLMDRADIRIGTRAGLRSATVLDDGRIRTGMGEVVLSSGATIINHCGRQHPAIGVNVGNPHAVVQLDTLADVDALDLHSQPTWEPFDAYPDGVNVEFIAEVRQGHLRMRVHERGVGETMSCGTGVVAAAAAYSQARRTGDALVKVSVPGGDLEVELQSGKAFLTGPAVIVYSGVVNPCE